MTFDRNLRHMIAEGKSSRDIEIKAVEQGMVEFRRAALLKVAQGLTSTEEVLRSVPVEYLGID
jgi:type II secretory ATPase GspE/PulE/Tfp pilus assembly ATPase PilB-like protein